MATTTVNGRLVNPVTQLPVAGTVTIVLVDYTDTPVIGFDAVDSEQILSAAVITPAADGNWTVQLVPTANIQLTNGSAQTLWRVTEAGGGVTDTYWINVPGTGPCWVGTIRTLLPGSVGPGPIAGLAVVNLSIAGTLTFDGYAIGTPPNDPAKFLSGDGTWRVGGGAVSSVNGHTGVVVLVATDVGALATAQNLADLANAATARTNLGLGAAAVANVGTTAGTVAAGNDSRITGAIPASTVTTKGDILAATGSGAVVRLGAGSDGQVLAAATGQPAGLAWSTPASPRDPYTAMLGLVSQPYPLDATDHDDLGTSAGFLILALNRPGAGLISNLGLWQKLAATGPGPASMAIFPGAGGSQLATTGDMSAALTSAANNDTYVEAALTVPYMAADGTDYYYGLFTNFVADAKIAGVFGTSSTLHIPSVKGNRPMIVIGGLSAMPASINVATATTAGAAYWLVGS